jgi:hypothetical protein
MLNRIREHKLFSFIILWVTISIFANAVSPIPNKNIDDKVPTIDDCFSKFDWSHIHLKRWISPVLKDADSYDHIKTTYNIVWERANVMSYIKAKNSFWAYITQWYTYKTDINCNIIDIDDI